MPPANFEALRLRLVQLRRDSGWSYDELAARSGVGRATLFTLESGKPRRTPGKAATRGSVETWYRIAHAFGVPLGELISSLYEDQTGH